jgi:WD40 repeat protein
LRVLPIVHHLASLPKTSQVINRSEKTAFGPVHLLLMTPNGLAVVTGSKDGTARIWDLGMGKMVGLVQGHGEGLACMALNPTGVRTAARMGASMHQRGGLEAACFNHV